MLAVIDVKEESRPIINYRCRVWECGHQTLGQNQKIKSFIMRTLITRSVLRVVGPISAT